MPRLTNRLLTCVVAILLLVPCFAAAQATRVTVGQPNVWTLDQAHYLLARMHERSAALEARRPGEADLDPAAIHGRRLDLLRSLLTASVSLDEPTGVANQLGVQNFEDQTGRRRELRAQLDQIRARQLEVAAEIAELQTEKALLVAAAGGSSSPAPDTGLLDAAITAKVAETEVLEGQVEALSSELAAIGTTVPTLNQPTGLSAQGALPAGVVQELARSAFSAGGDPKLHASTVLDNFVQLQYEIIAKQLSLLRDEVRPDEQLVFLELPQSIYTVPNAARDRLVRISWNFVDYLPNPAARTHESPYEMNEAPEDLRSLRTRARARPHAADGAGRVLDLIPRTSALNLNEIHGKVQGINLGARLARIFGFGASLGYQRERERLASFAAQDVFASSFGRGQETFGWVFAPHPGQRRIQPGDKTTFAVAAVPREAVFVVLEAEVCEFPRTLLPPASFVEDTDRWGRTHCTRDRTFELAIPNPDTERFFLTDIEYSSVAVGERATVFLHGRNFSPQTAVLVNGVPLERSVELARHTFPSPAPAGPSGAFEIVNSSDLVLSFAMGPGYAGTPVISLVTPTKTTPINYFSNHLRINRGKPGTSLFHHSQHHPMFRSPPKLTGFRLGATTTCFPARDPVCKRTCAEEMAKYSRSLRIAEIDGQNLRRDANLYLEGLPTCTAFLSPSRYQMLVDESRLPAPQQWRLRYHDLSSQRPDEHEIAVPNPTLPRMTKATILEAEETRRRLMLQGERLDLVHHVLVKGAKFQPREQSAVHLVVDLPPSPMLGLCTPTHCTFEPLPGPPKHPAIAQLAEWSSRKAEGPAGQSLGVTIRGEHLAGVKGVRFGDQDAEILVQTDKLLMVRTAAAGPGPVRVTLATEVGALVPDRPAASPSGIFTFTKPAE